MVSAARYLKQSNVFIGTVFGGVVVFLAPRGTRGRLYTARIHWRYFGKVFVTTRQVRDDTQRTGAPMGLTRLFISLILCLVSTGCISRTVAIDPDNAHGKNRRPSEPVACDIENPDCEGFAVRAHRPMRFTVFEGAAEDGRACPQVCIEIYACVQPWWSRTSVTRGEPLR